MNPLDLIMWGIGAGLCILGGSIPAGIGIMILRAAWTYGGM